MERRAEGVRRRCRCAFNPLRCRILLGTRARKICFSWSRADAV
jgi:hypothetical protein